MDKDLLMTLLRIEERLVQLFEKVHSLNERITGIEEYLNEHRPRETV